VSGSRRHFRFECSATLAVAVLAALPVLHPSETSAAQTRERPLSFERGPRDAPNVALTFDGGSDLGQSEQILAVLEQRGVSATFFLTGRFIQHHPELVRRIAAAGHEIGNHTWSHPHLTTWSHARRHELLPGLDREFLQRELGRTAREYEALTGRRMAPLWRAPYGEVNDDLLRWAAETGWSHAGWTRDDAGGRHTLDSLDWVEERSSRNYLSSTQIAERILTFGDGGDGLNGGIVLMHLCARREDPGVKRLGELIDALRRDGYRLVTVTELQGEPSRAPYAQGGALARRE
jgi:peptidoglycan-N-acetylglucosamine deacetylase